MIQVIYMEKIPKDHNSSNVEYERKIKETTKFDNPKSYKDFISKIANHFRIPEKTIELICLNNEGDEIGINNDEDLNNNLGEAKEFHVFKNGTKVDPIEPTDDEIKINIDIKDKDIENIIDNQIKVIEIDDKLNDVIEFDKDKYKDNLKKKTESYINNFKSQFDEKTNKIYDEKIKLFKDSIINKIGDYSKTQIDIIKKINTKTSDLNEGFSEIVNDANNMNNVMKELKDKMEKEPITKIKKKKLNKLQKIEVNKIFDYLEMEYNLSSILGREVIINKIIELKCDRKKIID